MYSKYTNDELIEVYLTMIDYSGKANETVLNEIDSRGGLEKFIQGIEQMNINKIESNRVLNEIIRLNKKEFSLEEIKSNIHSEIWTKQHLNAFIESRLIRHQLILSDKSIDKDLISKSFIGMLLASLAGTGILLFSVIVFNFAHFGLLVPVYFVSYLIIKGYAGKTHNNIIIFVTGLIATIISGISIFLILKY